MPDNTLVRIGRNEYGYYAFNTFSRDYLWQNGTQLPYMEGSQYWHSLINLVRYLNTYKVRIFVYPR